MFEIIQLVGLLSFLAINIANGQTIYSPADGYYLCQQAGAECLVTGCEEADACSILHTGFQKGMTGFGRSIYTATQRNASLSILVRDSDITTEVSCEAGCECQWITSDVFGCFEAPTNQVDAAVSNSGIEARQEQEDVNSNETPVRSIIVGALIPLGVVLIAGITWFGTRRMREREEKFSMMDPDDPAEVQTHAGGESIEEGDDYYPPPSPHHYDNDGEDRLRMMGSYIVQPPSFDIEDCGDDELDCPSVEISLK